MFSTNYHDDNYDGNHNSNINKITKGRISLSTMTMTMTMSSTSTSTSTSTSSEENDNSTTTSTTMKTSTAESCSSDEDTELMSPWMSFENNELQHDDAANNSCTSKGSSSSSSSSSWSTYQYIELRYTMISNLMFLTGASIQTYTAICDLKDSRADASMDDDDDSTDDDYVYTFGDDTYYVLYSLGPLLYFANACIDIRWQLDLISSPISLLSSFWCWCCVWCQRSEESSPSDIIDLNMEAQQEQCEEVKAITQESDRNFDDDEISLSTIQSTTASQYESERNQMYWGLAVAIIFCTGSLFEFYSTFLDEYYEDLDDGDDDTYLIKEEQKRSWYVSNYKVSFIAMHFYLLSGIVDLWARRKSYRSGCNSISCDIRRLFFCSGQKYDNEDPGKEAPSRENSSSLLSSRIGEFCIFLGTILFVLGTLLDCTISILCDPEKRHAIDPNRTIVLDEVVLDTCDLISSLLWNVDAILLIVADILLYSFHIEDSKARRWLSGSDQKRSATDSNTIPRQLFEQQQQESSSNNETIPLISDPTTTTTTTRLSDIAVSNYSTL